MAFKNHSIILLLKACAYRALRDTSLSVEGKYGIIGASEYFSQFYDVKGWMQYHKQLDSSLRCVNDIVEYYENKDRSLKMEHDKVYVRDCLGRRI